MAPGCCQSHSHELDKEWSPWDSPSPVPCPLSQLLGPAWGKSVAGRNGGNVGHRSLSSWLCRLIKLRCACVLKQINVPGPAKRTWMAPFEFGGIYFPSGLAFLRNVVQSRLDMKEALVGCADPKPPHPPATFTRCPFLN